MSGPWASLEPEALRGTADSDDQRVALSVAISLKRIADTLSGQGESILTTPINAYGETIGQAIQGQMVRGARGIEQT